MKKHIKVPAINWQDKSTWTLTGLSNWTVQRDKLKDAVKDAYHPRVRYENGLQYSEYIADAPAWATVMRANSIMLALLMYKFSGSGQEEEQLAIQAIIETYSPTFTED